MVLWGRQMLPLAERLQATTHRQPSPALDPPSPPPSSPPACLPASPAALQVCVYDPQVEADQIYQDLGTEKFEWDHPSPRSKPLPKSALDIGANAMEAAAGSHAICVLTEWDEFKGLDYQTIYDSMVKPAFIFDGRNILDHAKLRWVGGLGGWAGRAGGRVGGGCLFEAGENGLGC